MRYPPRSSRNILLLSAIVSACVLLSACGDTCFAGIFNNGNGIIITKTSSTPPACPSFTNTPMMNVAAVRSQICATCTASSRAEHIFITIQSIQLRSASSDPATTPQWIDLAPQLPLHPRQIDLVGDSSPLILVQNAPVPVGSYTELRLQFAPDTSASSDDALPPGNSCGRNRGNCLLMADGRVEALYFAGESPELLVPLQINGSNSLAVVPGGPIDLRLTLQPQQVSSVSVSQGWHVQFALTAAASISR